MFQKKESNTSKSPKNKLDMSTFPLKDKLFTILIKLWKEHINKLDTPLVIKLPTKLPNMPLKDTLLNNLPEKSSILPTQLPTLLDLLLDSKSFILVDQELLDNKLFTLLEFQLIPLLTLMSSLLLLPLLM